MTEFIATFYSHFGAIRLVCELAARGLAGRAMPVPRDLSSSCGTCVRFSSDGWVPEDEHAEIEKIVRVTPQGYETVYRATDS